MASNSRPLIGYLLKTFPKISETFILNEILELERQGLPLHIFSLRQPQDTIFHPALKTLKAEITYIPSLLPQFTYQNWLELQQAIKFIQVDKPQYINALNFYNSRSEEKCLNEFWQAIYLAQAMKKLGILHLHAHFANIPTAVAEMAYYLSGIPYSFTAHAKDIYLSQPKALDRKISQAKFVTTCTEYNQKYLLNLSTSNTAIHLSYHGLDLSRFYLSDRDKLASNQIPTILSVGRFCEKKGFPYLIQACKILKRNGIKLQCLIVGYGSLKAEIEQLIFDLNLEDCVSLLDKMTQDELIKLYHQADIFVLPCQVTDDGDRDGIPNVLLEAMAMQVPVISTDISGISELIEHQKNGILVSQKDPNALANEIANLIEQPCLRKTFGELGIKKVATKFCLEQNITQLKNLFISVLEETIQKNELKAMEVSLV